MKNILLIVTGLSCSIIAYSQQNEKTLYKPTWESLDSHKMPKWYDDAKIGLSMHWGVYAVPAWAPREEGISYAEWYGFRMHEKGNPTVDYHKEKYGNNIPSLITFATGPSRTADIEKTLVVGVHGPKEVYLFLVEA